MNKLSEMEKELKEKRMNVKRKMNENKSWIV
jgi:hypothetical protein